MNLNEHMQVRWTGLLAIHKESEVFGINAPRMAYENLLMSYAYYQDAMRSLSNENEISEYELDEDPADKDSRLYNLIIQCEMSYYAIHKEAMESGYKL